MIEQRSVPSSFWWRWKEYVILAINLVALALVFAGKEVVKLPFAQQATQRDLLEIRGQLSDHEERLRTTESELGRIEDMSKAITRIEDMLMRSK